MSCSIARCARRWRRITSAGSISRSTWKRCGGGGAVRRRARFFRLSIVRVPGEVSGHGPSTRFEITRQGETIDFVVRANAFLHHMVRNLVGTLVYVGKGKHPPGLGEGAVAPARTAASRRRPSARRPVSGEHRIRYEVGTSGGIVRTRIKICASPPGGRRARPRRRRRRRDRPRVLSAQPALSLASARAEIRHALPPYVQPVALFVNAEPHGAAGVGRVRRRCCSSTAKRNPRGAAVRLPYQRAARKAGLDLLDSRPVSRAAAWLLDSHVEEYGGAGRRLRLVAVPAASPSAVLSGRAARVPEVAGIRRCDPWAVDVSTRSESARASRTPRKIAAFIAGR